MPTLRVCHVINDLPVGGAEMMLYKLLSRMDRRVWDPCVISLLSRGPMTERIEALGVPVETAGMRRGVPQPAAMFRLGQLLRRYRPHLVQTWMYHSNLVAGLAARAMLRDAPVVWNIRMNSLQSTIDKRSTYCALRLGARLSNRLPEAIVVNSHAGRGEHAAVGYAEGRMVVIPNGFDVELFHPSPTSRKRLRRELKVDDETLLIGSVGRYHPHKDYGNLIDAAQRISARLGNVRLLLCGRGLDESNAELTAAIEQAGLRSRFHLLGPRDDVAEIQAALDLAVLPSCTEGFPNVVGEAMACGVPCAVTDVGAAADLVGDTGRVVPPRDPQALGDACLDLLSLERSARQELGRRARRRIERHFSIGRVTGMYTALWREVIERKRTHLQRAA